MMRRGKVHAASQRCIEAFCAETGWMTTRAERGRELAQLSSGTA